MTQFGPPQARELPAKPRSTRRSSAGTSGRGGKRGGADPPGHGRGRTAAAPPSAPPPARNALQQLAARVEQQEAAPRHAGAGRRHADKQAEDDHAAAAAAAQGRAPRRDMLSSLAELLGASQLAAYQQGGLEAVLAQAQAQAHANAAEQPRFPPPSGRRQQQWSEEEGAEEGLPGHGGSAVGPGAGAAQPADFSRRNMARLGGEGVAGIFGGGAWADQAGTGRPAAGGQAGAARGGGKGAYMSALADIKAGLSDEQRSKQALQREQLKRDLEDQMRQKKEAEAARKAALAELEEREEAQLKAYWAAQGRATQGEHQGQGGGRGQNGSGGKQQAGQGGRGGAASQGQAARQRQRQEQQAMESSVGAGRKAQPAGPFSPPGGSKRGEALVQPGITVFLPPDKEAERRGALRARLASQSASEEAEVVQAPPSGGRHKPSKPATPGTGLDLFQQALVQQTASLLAAQQQQQAAQAQAMPFMAPAQAAALLAAANPAHMYAFQPHLLAAAGLLGAPPATAAAAPAAPAAASSDPEVLDLLRELAAEQQRMRGQLDAQLEVVAKLSGDTVAARTERDRARQDLERVQRLLADRQAQATPRDGDMLSVTTHVLPLGVGIPSRLGTPAGRPGGAPHGRAGQQEAAGYGGSGAGQAQLPARYRQQAGEPWQKMGQQAAGSAAAGRGAGRAGGRGAAGAGGRGEGRAAAGVGSKQAPGAGRRTWKQ